MKGETFCELFGDIRESYIKEAESMKRSKKPIWLKWGTVAACLCLVVAGVLTVSNLQNETSHGQGTIAQVYTLSQVETMRVELVEWSADHFKGIVIDVGNNSIFPVDAELSVVFDYDTEILMNDGTVMVFNPDEPNTDVIGWKKGTIVTVKFVNYEEYREGNHFYNHVYASCVEIAD